MISFKFISDFYIRLKFLITVQNSVTNQVAARLRSPGSIKDRNYLAFLFLFLVFYTNFSRLFKNYFSFFYSSHWFKTSLLYFVGTKSIGSYHSRTYYSSGSAVHDKGMLLSQYDLFHNKYALSESKVKFFSKIFKYLFYYSKYTTNRLSYFKMLPHLGCLSKQFFFSYLKHLSSKKHKTKNEKMLRKFLIKNRFKLRFYLNTIVFSLFKQLNIDLKLKNLKKKFKRFIFKSININLHSFNLKSRPLKNLGLTHYFMDSNNLLLSLRTTFIKNLKSKLVYSNYRDIRFKALFKHFNLRLPKVKPVKRLYSKNNITNKNYFYKKANLSLYKNEVTTKKSSQKYKSFLKLNQLHLNKSYRFKHKVVNFFNSEVSTRRRWRRLLRKKKAIYKRNFKGLNYFSLAIHLSKFRKVKKFISSDLLLPNRFKREKTLLRRNINRLRTKKNVDLFSFSLNPEPHLIPIVKDIGYSVFLQRYGLGPDEYNFFYRNYYCIYKRKHESVSLKRLNRRHQFKDFHRIKFRNGYRLNTYKFFNRLLWRVKNRADKALPTHMHMGYLPLDIRAKKKAKLNIRSTHTFVNFFKRYRRNRLNDIRFKRSYIQKFIHCNFLTLFTYKSLKSTKLKTNMYVRMFNLSKHWRRIVKYEKSRFLQTVQYLQNRIAYYKNFFNYYSTSLFIFDSSMFTPILRSGKLFAMEKILYKLQLSSFINNLDIYKYWRKLMFLFDRGYKFNVKTFGRRRVLKKTIVSAAVVPLPTRLHSLYSDVYYCKEINSVNKFLRFIFQMKKTTELQYYKSALMSLDMDFDYVSVYRKYRIAKAKELERAKRLERQKKNNK